MERLICIHGHFYQPPRENPWLEAVEVQDSAYPHHDWNARVTAECYAPNARARILGPGERIVKIVNNYQKISFNFGPTLLSWMEGAEPDVYRAILEADRHSRERFAGHGSALAQAHSHLILPLANRRDKVTQVVWGSRDFEHRFDRSPAGMWLPETAVDTATLEILAEQGIRFTILAPHQARRFRELHGEAGWQEVGGGGIDTTRPYLRHLPSGRSIALFFYDGPTSRAVAFEGLLADGRTFAQRLAAGFPGRSAGAELVHIATDGETYGHHHHHGEMALAYALEAIEEEGLAELTTYARFLDLHPPEHEVEIAEETSWSCAHGIERWRSDCGCSTGGQPGWHQGWRAPLREALDWLRDELAPRFESAAGELLADPWRARDEYVTLLLDPSPESRERFFARHGARPLGEAERVRALELLELQRQAIYMYTSCGWFFNELSGIETVQVLLYAGRALQLGMDLFGDDLEPGFLERLARAESNLPEHGDGRRVFEKFVRPARIDLPEVAAHYAMSSLFEDYPEDARIFCYRAAQKSYRRLQTGRAKLAVGRVEVSSLLTGESADLSFGVLHFGDHNLSGGVREFRGPEAFEEVFQAVGQAFERADFTEILGLLDRYFGELTYSLRSLFRDEQRKVTDLILEPTFAEVEAQYRHIYEQHAPLMRFLSGLGNPLPSPFRAAAEFVLTLDLRRAFEDPEADLEEAARLLRDTAAWGLQLDTEGLSFALEGAIDALGRELREEPDRPERLERLAARVALARSLPFPVELWEAQNAFWEILQTRYPEAQERAAAGDEAAREWVEGFRALGERLAVRVE